MDNNYGGHFKRTIVFYLFHYENYYLTHCFRVYVFTNYMLIVCPHTLNTMNSYKIISNVIAIGLQK